MPNLEHENLWQDQSDGDWSLDWYGLKSGGLDCSHLFPQQQLHLMFNISGQGVILGERTRVAVSSSTLSVCYPDNHAQATRIPGSESHEFIILSMQANWLKKQLGDKRHSIFESILSMVSSNYKSDKPVGHVRFMTMSEREMAMQLVDPPVEGDAIAFWYVAKVTEIIALHLFRTPGSSTRNANEPFCLSRKRVVSERVQQVNEWLDANLDQALNLKQLAKHVGCAPHYLSRLFSHEVGKTISLQLREMRIRRAAQLMDTGHFNVTEAAVEVGYNSLSHFTKAFAAEVGIKPSVYLKQV